jgi:Zn finger protein HypA/HybF involved in hydrogenase expression
VPARLRCEPCEREWEMDLPLFVCSVCGAAASVSAGDEFEVESIEVEEAECIAQR